jgi:hypothetical protein
MMPPIPPAPRRRTEATIQDEVRRVLGTDPRVWLLRNNVGAHAETSPGGFQRWARYGLGDGSADLVGIVTMPDGLGRFIALEVKSEAGKLTEAQASWLELVRRRGGFAAVVRSAADARAAVERALRGERQ